MIVVRENTEGMYVGAGGVLRKGTANEIATQESLNTRYGVERIVRYAFDQAIDREAHLTLCHKTNVLAHAGDLWQRTVDEVGADYPDVATDYVHVDAMCLYMVTTPERFDVVVTDNLFGDIITDLGAAVQGGMGLAASGNLNPSGDYPSMFEPVHGSAPDIAGKGWANPVAAVLSVAICPQPSRRERSWRGCRTRRCVGATHDGRNGWSRHGGDHRPTRRPHRGGHPRKLSHRSRPHALFRE